MNDKEKIEKIQALVDWHQQIEDHADRLSEVLGSVDGPLFNTVNEVFAALVVRIAQDVGDGFEWINWFIFENKCGSGGLAAQNDSIGGKMVEIKDVETLVKVCLS